MARKTKEVVITEDGRDKGKHFIITEMPAAQAEKWGWRMLLLAASSGADVGSAIGGGMLGVALAGIQTVMSGIRFPDLEPLLDEMMECVQVRPAANDRDIEKSLVVRRLVPEDVEEWRTLITLRSEVFTLHVGFSFADALSRSTDGQTMAPAA